MKRIINKIRNEQGQALPIVLILMVIGGLIIAPLLSYMSSGLLVGEKYEAMADELYAADSGVEDGLWEITNNRLDDLFSGYDEYDYDTVYEYPAGHPVVVNGLDVDISIQNVWVPYMDEPADADEAHDIITAGKLIITGNIPDENIHQVKIYYYKGEDDDPLQVNEIGIWIPPGFTYDGECTLETWLDGMSGIGYSRDIYDHCGGQAVVWTLSNVDFTDLPNVIAVDQPMASNFTFKYATDLENRRPEAIAWMETSGVSDIPYTWDADVKAYHIISQAGGEDGTTVEAYALKSELRELGSARAGDYVAIGNTLMTDEYYDHGGPVRDTLWNESDATADTIPANARVDAAYLYWSGWVTETQETVYFEDECNDKSQWIEEPNSDWSVVRQGWNWLFQGHHNSGGDRYLEMENSINLSECESETAIVYWQQSASWRTDDNDCLKFQFSADGGATWWGDGDEYIPAFCGNNPTPNFSYIIPDEYLTDSFKMRFYLDGFNQNREYAYIDNIKISVQEETMADTSVIFKIDGDEVYFADDGDGNLTVPTKGTGYIIAKDQHVLENQPNEYSYACKTDVTELVQEFTATGNGNATYTVGDVYAETDNEWSYAAWSLIIIYASPETRGHQLYLYDTEFIYVDNNGKLEYPISGFLVPDPITDPDTGELLEENSATITCFIGEGDDYYPNDYIALNAPYFPAPNSYKLWDGTYSDEVPGSNTPSYPNNVWNSKSLVISEDGIDIDTFYIPWGDPPDYSSIFLEPQDTSATVVLQTETDSWNLIYIIISFRSDAVTGGTVTYLIRE